MHGAAMKGRHIVIRGMTPVAVELAPKSPAPAHCSWGGDGWTHDLRRSGAPDGATFKDWQWWPNTLQAHRWSGFGIWLWAVQQEGAVPGTPADQAWQAGLAPTIVPQGDHLHTPHTLAHQPPPPAAPRRLVALAKQHGKGHEANALLFRMSYEEGANISSREALLEAGERLGLPGVAEYLDGDGGLAEVQEDNSCGKRE